MLVVASFSDWDGYRIIGVFSSKKIALKEIEKSGLKLSNASLSFDLVSKNEISFCQEVVQSDEIVELENGMTVRKHIYE